MKNVITKTVMAAGVVAVMGATYAVAGGVSNNDEMTSGAFVEKSEFSTTEMMAHLSADNGAGIFGGVKSVLGPVKDYVMNTAFETTSCIVRIRFS